MPYAKLCERSLIDRQVSCLVSFVFLNILEGPWPIRHVQFWIFFLLTGDNIYAYRIHIKVIHLIISIITISMIDISLFPPTKKVCVVCVWRPPKVSRYPMTHYTKWYCQGLPVYWGNYSKLLSVEFPLLSPDKKSLSLGKGNALLYGCYSVHSSAVCLTANFRCGCKTFSNNSVIGMRFCFVFYKKSTLSPTEYTIWPCSKYISVSYITCGSQ